VTAFVGPRVGTMPFGATADTCAETAECRLQCTRRGVRTANLRAVRSAITATAELLVSHRHRLFHPNFGGVLVGPDRPHVGVSPSRAELFGRDSVKLFSKYSNLCDHGT